MGISLPQIVTAGVFNSNKTRKGKIASVNRRTAMFEIELATEASGQSYIDGDIRPNELNTLICVHPGQVRHTVFPRVCYYVHFILDEGNLYDALMSAPSFITIDNYDKCLKLFRRMIWYHNSNIEWDKIMVQSLVLELIYTISKYSEIMSFNSDGTKDKRDVVKNALNYIKDNLNSDLSLESVADYSGFSPRYFHTFFKKATGKTLRKYVEEQRIRKAVDLIVSTNMTLTQIAYECGFSSQSYFSYAFKHILNITPREYEKKMNKKYYKEE